MSSMLWLYLALMRFSVLDLLVLISLARSCVTLLLKLLSQVRGISMLIMIIFLSIHDHIYRVAQLISSTIIECVRAGMRTLHFAVSLLEISVFNIATSGLR